MSPIILPEFKKLVNDNVFIPTTENEINKLNAEIKINTISAIICLQHKMYYTAAYYIDQCIECDAQLKFISNMDE